MPTISTFYGITIYMYFNDHNPPHIHASYSGKDAKFNIQTGVSSNDSFPKNATRLVCEFIELHRDELMTMWETKVLATIPGLD